MDENRRDFPERPYDEESAYSPGKWRACCLAPTIALGAILLIVVVASLYSPEMRENGEQVVQDEATTERREAFVQLGQEYFAIALEADEISETAFGEMASFVNGGGSLERVHSAFRRASEANRQAAAEFQALEIPEILIAREKIRQSSDTMSEAYESRADACDILVAWNGDLEDESVAREYADEVDKVNRLTFEGLTLLGEAAEENGLTRDDMRRIVPADVLSLPDVIPWGRR